MGKRSNRQGLRPPAWLSTTGLMYGDGAYLVVVSRTGRRRKAATAQIRAFRRPSAAVASEELLRAWAGGKLKKQLGGGALAEMLSAAGHATRLAILGELLAGPATYRQLVGATGRRAGPLYHHINKLRLTGLVSLRERDLYELTARGRMLILALMAVGKLAHTRA